jgi:hypothetical protein
MFVLSYIGGGLGIGRFFVQGGLQLAVRLILLESKYIWGQITGPTPLIEEDIQVQRVIFVHPAPHI